MSKKYLDDIGLSHLWDKIKSKISSMIADEAGKMKPYGYCTTASKTVAKVVTVSPAITELTTGLTIAVKFEYANGVANPTLNVNGTGAKAIKRYGTTAPATSAAASWNANSVITLTYDGTYWQMGDWNNTTYSSMSVAEYEAGTSTSARVITPARLKDAIEYWADKNVNADWNATSGDAQILNKPSIPTRTTELENDSDFVTTVGLTENCTTNTHILVVNGSNASLYYGGSPSSLLLFLMHYMSVAGLLVAQVLNNSSSLQTAQARAYQIAEVDATTAKVRLVSIDNGVVYTADLQDTGDGLTGTFSSQTIGEGGALFVDDVQANGDLTLYTPSGNSPGIIFQRGTLTDNYNDWKIYDKSGFLYFAQRGSGSSAFGDVGYIDTGGVLRNFTIPWGSVSGKPTQLPTVTASDNGKVLRVVNGEWTAVSLPSASGVSF